MKKILLSLLLVLALCANQSFASSNTDLFAVDEVSLTEIFSPLQELEEVVVDNPQADVNFIQANYSGVLNAVNLFDAASGLTRPMEDRQVAGISGYIWGACLGIAGVAIVYFLLDDASKEFRKKETTNAVVGCVVSTVVWTVLYFTLLATYFGRA